MIAPEPTERCGETRMVAPLRIPDVVAREMRAGEHARWIGYPNPRRFAIKEGGKSFLVGIAWIALIKYLTFSTLKPETMFLRLWDVLLFLFGIYLISSPLQQYWRAH